jgi:hypothetical protein
MNRIETLKGGTALKGYITRKGCVSLKGYERKILRKMIMHELESVTWYIKYRENNFFIHPNKLEVLRKRKRTLLEMYKKLNRGVELKSDKYYED